MSDANPPGGLQFDRAEFQGDPVALACASCGTAIRSAYYQVGSAITCERCRRQMEYDATQGSAVGRFAKATLLGLVAAGLGAGLYYGVRALTGYEFGLIAVVVGVAVGAAVRAGSGQRGGVPYQLLAMFLTYVSIVSTYIPDVVKGLNEREETKQAEAAAPAQPPAAAPATATPAGSPAAATPAPTPAPSFLGFLVALVVLTAVALAIPFLLGFQNAIGLVIIAIGLYEAWKINRKPDRTVTGPFRIETPAPAVPSS